MAEESRRPDEADVETSREKPEPAFINYESFELILRHRVHDMKNKKVFDIEDPIIVRYSMIHGFGEYMRIPGHLTYILDELFNDLQRTYRQRILEYEHTEGASYE